VTEDILLRARRGDSEAFGQLTDPYRRQLQLHCYRMLGSTQDAEDMLQETLLAAWRGIKGFEGRSLVRSWLYCIATNQCLNALRDKGRRPVQQPLLPEPAGRGDPSWLEPYPDVLLEGIADARANPEARYETKESISLAFVAAIQHLPPTQRAALVLRDALGFTSSEVAEFLDSSEAAVNSALQRARSTLERRIQSDRHRRAPLPRSSEEDRIVERFTAAFERGDVDNVVALLTKDAWFTMPLESDEFYGPKAIGDFLRSRFDSRGGRRYRLVATRANGQPAFGGYIQDPQAPIAHAHGMMVLTLDGDRICGITRFTDLSVLARFGLPRTLRQEP
jgi:RNA polymerase sigma-70 factor (TIGR02960 family)